MAKANKTKYAMLGMLTASPCSGYDIKKMCDISISHFWNENYAHIYPVLKDLEKEGMVTKASEQKPGRPPKNVYTITDTGREALMAWLLEPVERGTVRNEFLLKLFFSENLPGEATRELIQREKERVTELRKVFEAQRDEIDQIEGLKNHPQRRFWTLSLNYGLYDAEAVIRWCDDALKSLEEQ